MGEAKRRKQLDPTYGQPKPIQTLLEFAQAQYQILGRGMLIYPGVKGQPSLYVSGKHSSLGDGFQALIETYDPETQVVLHYPVNIAHQDGAWLTEILDGSSPKTQFRVEVAA
jgi:hypothetical protein